MTVHDIVLCQLQLKSPCMYCVDDENEMHIK